jgi:hypothetical protein
MIKGGFDMDLASRPMFVELLVYPSKESLTARLSPREDRVNWSPCCSIDTDRHQRKFRRVHQYGYLYISESRAVRVFINELLSGLRVNLDVSLEDDSRELEHAKPSRLFGPLDVALREVLLGQNQPWSA